MQDIIRSVTAAQELNLSMDLIDNGDSHNNCTEEVRRKSGLNLLSNPTHRLVAVKVIIERAIKEVVTVSNEKIAPIPVVSTSQNFDSLLIPKDHYCRRASDVYYVSENALLRTHLTAHMVESVSTEAAALAVGGGEMAYFMIGPVFRRIEEDERQSELSHQVRIPATSSIYTVFPILLSSLAVAAGAHLREGAGDRVRGARGEIRADGGECGEEVSVGAEVALGRARGVSLCGGRRRHVPRDTLRG